jgi:hypothetical protein
MTLAERTKKPTEPIVRWEGNVVIVVRKIGKWSLVRLPNGIQLTVANRELKKEI